MLILSEKKSVVMQIISYIKHRYSEVFAECFSNEGKNKHFKDTLNYWMVIKVIILSKEMIELRRLSKNGETEEIREGAAEKYRELFSEMVDENEKKYPYMDF